MKLGRDPFFYLCIIIVQSIAFGCQQPGFQILEESQSNQRLLGQDDPQPNYPATQPSPLPGNSTDSVPPIPAPRLDSKPTSGRGGVTGLQTGRCNNQRAYQVYVPASYNESQPTPIVVAMHGAGDTHTNFASVVLGTGWQALSEQQGFIVLIPSHTNQNRRSFLHFNSNMSLNTGATQAEGLSLLDCIYYGVGSRYNIETHQIYWMGFSEGASFTAYLASYLSKQLRGVAIFGGSAPRVSSVITRRLPIYFLSGTGDFNYSGIVTQSETWVSHPHQRQFVNAGHSFVQLNNLVRPSVVWQWLRANQSPEPVESQFR